MKTKEAVPHLFWAMTPEDVASALETDLTAGLSRTEAAARLKTSGMNRFGEGNRFSKLRLLAKQFKSPLIFILVIAGGVTLVMQHWIDAGVIFLAIGVNTFLGFYQENRAENALAHLRSYIQERTRVIRDGTEHEVDAATVVPGDVIHLMPGSRIPADARLISTHELHVDESILTGESLAVEKSVAVVSEAALLSDRTSMVFGGTLVTQGSATAVVVSTGNTTEIGRIAELVKETKRELTPIQKAVSKLSWVIAIGVTFLIAGIFALGLYRGEPVFDMFLVSIAVAVGAIPEALPIALTAVLAVGVEQLARRKGIMRDLTAAETLGSTTVIITDKTGTLTEANMQLVDVFTTKDMLSGNVRATKTTARERFSQEQKDILYLASLNTDVLVENPEDAPEEWRMSGNQLEKNIVRSAALHGASSSLRTREHGFQTLLAFNSTNKFSVTRGELNIATNVAGGKKGKAFVLLGAPDVLLARAALEKDEYISLLKHIEAMSAEGKRVLGVAAMHTEDSPLNTDNDDPVALTGVRFVGILAFYDPVRTGAPAAIAKMEQYGVRVVMATGDIQGTAVAVAKELGWDVGDNAVLTGDQVRQLNDDELREALALVRVFARVTPEDKLRIAQLYQKRGEVVAMTGDGINDAPSLKAADIGIAVGSGTDVAKGVAGLVLLDDNFDVIVAAIEEGKRILRNIRKTFVYLMSNSLDEVILIGGSLLVGLSLPLTAIQIIWVNFFTGSLPAVAFAFDDDNDLGVPEKKTDKHILNNEVKFLTLGIGVLTSVLLFVLYWFLMRTSLPEAEVKTFLFACFSVYILFVAFSLRSLKRPIFSYNIFSNRFLVAGVGVGLALLAATIYVPFLQTIFTTTALGVGWVVLIGVWVVFNIALVEGAKWLFYR